MKRILVCEDEASIRDFVVINLRRAGYDVVDTSNGEEALEVYKNNNGGFDVALLDIMMPGMDGCELCKRIREQSAEIGIIMLSAKSQEIDKINCLMLGADDYVTKPFSPSELVARIDAIYRRVTLSRSPKEETKVITAEPFKLDLQSRMCYKNGELIELTQVEFHMMKYLLSNKGTAIDRKSILRHIWGDSYVGEDKVIDVNMRRLRMKIEDDPSSPKYIQTIWGFGYKWNG
ncbi:MAG: response regulator transcription factor [Oscillospiraceae bacterium]|nr:response regulator transcription factor [Oscillospiraceae bacterium]